MRLHTISIQNPLDNITIVCPRHVIFAERYSLFKISFAMAAAAMIIMMMGTRRSRPIGDRCSLPRANLNARRPCDHVAQAVRDPNNTTRRRLVCGTKRGRRAPVRRVMWKADTTI